jgi:translation initiation factor eIF-2B subunit delta
VQCKYTLINSAGCLISSTTKVFIEAEYVLGNGAVVARMGTSMIAYLASQYKVPVIAWCETYKFTQRVNLDQVKNNQPYEAERVYKSDILPFSQKEKSQLQRQKNLHVRYLKYDFTPVDCISVIICEIGRLSPVSVPVIVEEFYQERQQRLAV